MGKITNLTPDLSPEFIFQSSRSSGAGGQNVNKLNTKVELRFSILNSIILNEVQKQILFEKLKGKLTDEGYIIVVSQEERSQLKNKILCVNKLYSLINKALTPQRKRKATKPTELSIEKRIDKKRKTGEKKNLRKKPSV